VKLKHRLKKTSYRSLSAHIGSSEVDRECVERGVLPDGCRQRHPSLVAHIGAIEVDQECAERGVPLDNARVRRVLQAITQQGLLTSSI
jgi:hypothetical protein